MREHIRQRIRHLTAMMLILTFTLTGTVNVFAAAAELIPVDVALYTDTNTSASTETEVLWSDEWFTEPTTEYNHELAITSIALSDLAYLQSFYGVHSDSEMHRTLQDLGFDDGSIMLCNYDYPYTKDDNDAVAFILAAKEIDDDVLIAVIIRGTANDFEWDSDLRVSEDPNDYLNAQEHYGFYESERKLLVDLNNYIAALAGSNDAVSGNNVKFYITGHSRGGSVADILAAELNAAYGKDRVYAYTFGAPGVAVGAGENGYENIFNIVSADDHLSDEPFTRFDFSRFGVDKVIDTEGDYESQNDEDFRAHDPFVYYSRLKSGLPDTLYE